MTQTTKEERYPRSGGIYYACFNASAYDQRVARKMVIERFGLAGWNKIKRINRTGLLAMFHVAQIPETKLYAETIAERVEKYFRDRDEWAFGKPEPDRQSE